MKACLPLTSPLTEQEREFFESLKGANMNTLWGYAIDLVINNPTPERVRELIRELKSQDKDNRELMIDILGPECHEKLIAI